MPLERNRRSSAVQRGSAARSAADGDESLVSAPQRSDRQNPFLLPTLRANRPSGAPVKTLVVLLRFELGVATDLIVLAVIAAILLMIDAYLFTKMEA